MKAGTVGIDLAKNVFQLHVSDKRGGVIPLHEVAWDMRTSLNLALNAPGIARNFKMIKGGLSLGRQCGANRKFWRNYGD